jgi:hypothetical protein
LQINTLEEKVNKLNNLSHEKSLLIDEFMNKRNKLIFDIKNNDTNIIKNKLEMND